MTDFQQKLVRDERGVLHVLNSLPFPAVRMFAIAKVPPGMKRGGHAHRTCQQVIYCVAGGCRLDLSTGRTGNSHAMTPGYAVHVWPMTWIVLRDFTPDAVLVVLASEPYTRPISDEGEFLREVESGSEKANICAEAGAVG